MKKKRLMLFNRLAGKTAQTGDHVHPAELEAYADGALPSARATAVRQHLARCPSCRQQWQAEQTLITALQQSAPAERPLPPTLATQLQANLYRRMRRSMMFNQMRFSVGQLAAALLLLTAVGLLVWWQAGGFAPETEPLTPMTGSVTPEGTTPKDVTPATATPAILPPTPTATPATAVTPQTITHLVAPTYQETAQLLVRRFNQAQTQWRVQLSSQLPSGWPETPITTATDCFTGGSGDLAQLAPHLLSLDEYLAAEPDLLADYPPALLDAYRQDGRLLGLPATLAPQVLYYNASHLAAQGLELPPTTWAVADFWELATAATVNEAETPIYGYIPLDPSGQDGLSFLLAAAETTYYRAAPPQATYDDPALAQLLRQLAVAVESGVLYPLDMGGTRSDIGNRPAATAAIRQGQAAFWPNLAGLPNGLLTADPPNFAVGVAPLPYNVPLIPQQSMAHFISRQAEYPAGCWAWLTFLTTQPEMVTPGIPARQSVAASAEYAAIIGQPQAEVYRALLDELAFSPEPATAVPPPLQQWWEDALAAVGQDGVAAEVALAQAQSKGQAALECLRERGVDGEAEAITSCAQEADPTYQTRDALGGFLLLDDAYYVVATTNMMQYRSAQSVATAVAFYQDALIQRGFRLDESQSSATPEATNLLFVRENGETRRLLITPQGPEISVTLTGGG